MAKWIHNGFQSEAGGDLDLADYDMLAAWGPRDLDYVDGNGNLVVQQDKDGNDIIQVADGWTYAVDDNFRSNFFVNIQQLCTKSSGPPVTKSSLYFALLRQWLKVCDKYHTCKPKAQIWPTRIIFVGNSDSTELELWETESKQAQLFDVDGYVALSYCWGLPLKTQKKQFCTTRENYRRRLKGFSMNDLPKTFKDAVQVTRALGKQYLWIDALCIIQAIEGADDSDWKIEASCMEQVFSSAYCTIAASSAEDWTKGFLERKSNRRSVQDVLDAFKRWKSTCHSVQDVLDALKRWKSTPRFVRYAGRWKPADYTNDVDAARLNQRAWVLQERVLSRRTIYFTESHILGLWRCGALRKLYKTEMPTEEGILLYGPRISETSPRNRLQSHD